MLGFLQGGTGAPGQISVAGGMATIGAQYRGRGVSEHNTEGKGVSEHNTEGEGSSGGVSAVRWLMNARAWVLARPSESKYRRGGAGVELTRD
eukprot:scaffold19553_cov94-Isochrysis_galbana.AAC.4